ncbi:MAG: hypothetical protein KQH57_12675 [Actinomycetales bacterium]|nr:hypothetical protein [Actinomycetales bacterium]
MVDAVLVGALTTLLFASVLQLGLALHVRAADLIGFVSRGDLSRIARPTIWARSRMYAVPSALSLSSTRLSIARAITVLDTD